MQEQLHALLKDLRYEVIDRLELEPRPARFAPLPPSWASHPVARLVDRFAGQLWVHQTEALAYLERGAHVVLSTATASGKSLVFILAALRTVLDDNQARVLIFYPLKALSQDQENKWREAIRSFGLPEEILCRIDGSIAATQREALLAHARIALLTPDIAHHWLLRQASGMVQKEFLAHIALIGLDEAHVYDALFGTNTAFLLRRLLSLRAKLASRRIAEPRFIAASATMVGARDHMRRLTGHDFTVIDESKNGAPHAGRDILHISFDSRGNNAYDAFGKLLAAILEALPDTRFIAFADSRQGVEKVSRTAAHWRSIEGSVFPYRAGLEEKDREEILRALQSGRLRGVVSTSALELGLDIHELELGLNLGLPWSRRAFHQRLGRIGRQSRGCFCILAPFDQFAKTGLDLKTYYELPPEPTTIYLHNRFVQYAHARCLVRELEDKENRKLPSQDWPEGFADIYQYALPGAGRPAEFDSVHRLGGDDPHLTYGLRANVETQLQIVERLENRKLGNMDLKQAIREAYPGACYLYLGQPYRVEQWKSGIQQGEIFVAKMSKAIPTQPMLEIYVNLDMTDERNGGIINAL